MSSLSPSSLTSLRSQYQTLDHQLTTAVLESLPLVLSLGSDLGSLSSPLVRSSEAIRVWTQEVQMMVELWRDVGERAKQKKQERERIRFNKRMVNELVDIQQGRINAQEIIEEIGKGKREESRRTRYGKVEVNEEFSIEIDCDEVPFENGNMWEDEFVGPMGFENAMKLERLSWLIPKLKSLVLLRGKFDIAKQASLQLPLLSDAFKSILNSTIGDYLKLYLNGELHKIDAHFSLVVGASVRSQASGFTESIIDDILISPILDRHISSSILHYLLLEDDANQKLFAAFRNLVADLKLAVAPFLKLLIPSCSCFKEFNIAANVLWNGIYTRLESQSRLLVSAANASSFHSNYVLCRDLINQLTMSTEIVVYDYQREQILKCKSLNQFQKLWNLPIYFQLCVQTITQPLLSLISEQDVKENVDVLFKFSNPEENSDFHFAISKCLKKSIVICFDSNYFLKEIGSQFLKLALELFVRFRQFLISTLEAIQGKKKDLPIWLCLLADLDAIINWFNDPSNEAILIVLSAFAQDSEFTRGNLLILFSNAFKDCALLLEETKQSFQSKISVTLLHMSLETLKEIPKILTTYRMTGKPAPIYPSAYASSFAEIINYLRDALTQRVSKSILAELFFSVGDQWIPQAEKGYRDVFDALEKAEKSMKKLASVSAETLHRQIEDSLKIRMQFSVNCFYSGKQIDMDVCEISNAFISFSLQCELESERVTCLLQPLSVFQRTNK